MAIGDIGWLVNGMDIESALGGSVQSAGLYRPPIVASRTVVKTAGEHGSVAVGLPVFDDPTLIIHLRLFVSSQADLETKVAQIHAVLTAPTLTVSRRYVSGVQSAPAVLVSITHDGFVFDTSVLMVISLSIPGVFLRGSVWTSADIAAQSDVVAAELTGLSDSTAPIGDAILRITGPCVNPYVSDPGTGTGLSYIGTVSTGQYLFMAARSLSARLSSSSADWLSGGSDVSAALSYPGAGRLQLWPVVQTATTRKVLISMTASSGRTSATKLAVRGQAAYL